jgi:hypothetical protein
LGSNNFFFIYRSGVILPFTDEDIEAFRQLMTESEEPRILTPVSSSHPFCLFAFTTLSKTLITQGRGEDK